MKYQNKCWLVSKALTHFNCFNCGRIYNEFLALDWNKKHHDVMFYSTAFYFIFASCRILHTLLQKPYHLERKGVGRMQRSKPVTFQDWMMFEGTNYNTHFLLRNNSRTDLVDRVHSHSVSAWFRRARTLKVAAVNRQTNHHHHPKHNHNIVKHLMVL